MLLGVAGTYWTPARRWLHTRLRMPLLKTLRLRSTGDVTLGEIILSLSFVSFLSGMDCLSVGCDEYRCRTLQWGLFVYWILYWTGTASFATPLYNRIVKEAQVGPGSRAEYRQVVWQQLFLLLCAGHERTWGHSGVAGHCARPGPRHDALHVVHYFPRHQDERVDGRIR